MKEKPLFGAGLSISLKKKQNNESKTKNVGNKREKTNYIKTSD